MTKSFTRRRLLGTATAIAAGAALTGAGQSRQSELMYVGSWNGTSLYGLRFDPVTGALTPLGAVATVFAGWTAAHPHRPVLYVGEGMDGGFVSAYAVDGGTGTLTRTGRVATDAGGTAGGGIALLRVHAPTNTLLVANFEAGLIASVSLDADGRLGAVTSTMTDTGSGPNPRQLGPHPHDVVVDPTGHWALVPDFGADRVFVYRYDRGRLSAAAAPGYATAAGSGPRRIVFQRGGQVAYLLNELTADLHVLDWDARDGSLTARQILSTDTAGHTGTSSAAELRLGEDGRFVYASNRGENMLVVLAADTHTGELTPVQHQPCGGSVPWSFTIHRSGRWLLVANEASGTVNVFAVDPQAGTVTATGVSATVPTPDGITFLA
jgi:6-phosphogluconolactonase (cycloisomerase 2 family)